MFLIGFITGVIVGGIATLFLHCCLILAKESDNKILTKESKN